MTVVLRYAARSDVGLVRSNNQDSGYAGPRLLAVADGMGGHAGGDVASSLVIARLAQLDADPPATDIVDALESAILEANQAILDRAQEEPELAGLGTTVTALLRTESKFALAHIGDSRAYLLRDEELTQVTKDHSFVQRLVDEGRLTPEEAERHPRRSALLRVLGDVDSSPDLDLSLRPAQANDRWLLCSDGLSGMVSNETIRNTLVEYSDPGECADKLVQLALKGGGSDNVTCVVADVLDLSQLPAAASTSSAVEVVGSAALERNKATTATGSAARAAALLAPEPDPAEADAEAEEDIISLPKRRILPVLVVATLAALLLGALGWFGYSWTKTQYFIGTDGNHVVIYRGINQDIGSFPLYEKAEQTDINLTDLPQAYQDRVQETIPADSKEGADEVIKRLSTLSTKSPIPNPTQTPSQAPTPTPTTSTAGAGG